MTVARKTAMPGCVEPPTGALSLDEAYEHVRSAALADSRIGDAGIEAETHLVDLRHPHARVPWQRIEAVTSEISDAAHHSAVTFEPGGQVELSGPPLPDIATAVAAVRDDLQRVRVTLARHDLGLAHVGADPCRPAQRVNPRARYQAMDHHFAACSLREPSAIMMSGTAALQLNLQAGPRAGWAARVSLAHRLGPTLSALAACSRWVGGHDTGHASARQRAWQQLNARTTPVDVDSDDPRADWAAFALSSPVLFVSCPTGPVAVPGAVTFAEWATGGVRLGGRAPDITDLDTHLTTLFPPVRLRGFIELRYLDMTPPRWWPAIAAVTATLLDVPAAADAARVATEGTELRWTEAARDGLDDPPLAEAAARCLDVAVDHAPESLRHAVIDLRDLVASGSSPGDEWTRRITALGPTAALQEAAHA